MYVERSSAPVQTPAPSPAAASILSRRAVLAALLVGMPALAACSVATPKTAAAPDPLIGLADAAHADAALAAAALAADPALRDRVEPLRAARAAHAAALDNALGRSSPTADGAPPAAAVPTSGTAAARATAAPGEQRGTIIQLHDALLASAKAASGAALTAPVDRVGLVASVAACCSAYASTL